VDFLAFARRALTPPPQGRCLLRFPERELFEYPSLLSRDWLRRKRCCLVSEIALDEQVLADAIQIAGGRGEAERGFVRHRAHDERGNVIGVSEADTGFMGGVGALNELLCEGEIGANEDIDVLVGALGFLCVSHVQKITL
jgi:hypothetical protein